MRKTKGYMRRWRGFKPKEVSERMSIIAQKRFKSVEEKKEHARRMVEARGSWQVINGERIYVKREKRND